MFRLFVLTILLTTPIFAMAKDIFISSHSAVSNRFAVFEDDERVAFLYLTDVGSQKPIKEAIAYSRVSPISRVDWEKIKETGDTPLLEQSLASNEAVISNPNGKEFSFKGHRMC